MVTFVHPTSHSQCAKKPKRTGIGIESGNATDNENVIGIENTG
jgi:hypothetical protein